MTSRYFFWIQFIPEHADNNLLAAKCIETLHGFSSSNNDSKNTVGVSFPRWNNENVGNAIAFISTNRDLLVGLSFQPYFTNMQNEGLFEINTVEPVPEGLGEVHFVRNQTIKKCFIGSKSSRPKRCMKRAEERGEQYVPVSREEREFELFHTLKVDSKSTQQIVYLHVQRKVSAASEQSEGYGGYGLATNNKWRGTVPELSF